MKLRTIELPLLGLWVLYLTACATTRPAARTPVRELVMEPLRIQLEADPDLGLTDFDASTLFHEGLRLQESGQCEQAVRFYDRLGEEFPDSQYRSAAAYNAGRCLESLERLEEAVARYRRVTEALPRSRDWVDCVFRLSESLARLGRPGDAIRELERLLARQELSASDRLEAHLLLGENHMAHGDTLAAERELRSALRLYREHGREEYLDPAPAARAEYRLAELASRRFEAAPLRLPEEQMRIDLEQKAQRLLEAQNGYLRCMRHGDPDWATAAGFQVGQLYLGLHRAMAEAPVPEELGPEERAVYRELLQKRTAVLLRKALRVFEMTLQLGERTGTENDWTQAVRAEMQKVEQQVLGQLEAPEDRGSASQPAPEAAPEPEPPSLAPGDGPGTS